MSSDYRRISLSDLAEQDEWALYSLLTRVIFDAFVQDIVRGRYQIHNPGRVTLHVTQDEAVLFVTEGDRLGAYEGSSLLTWAFDLFARDLLNLAPEDVHVIYLDGFVGGGEPYLYVAGEGIMLSSGEPLQKGSLL